jgi:hypothetical protein
VAERMRVRKNRVPARIFQPQFPDAYFAQIQPQTRTRLRRASQWIHILGNDRERLSAPGTANDFLRLLRGSTNWSVAPREELVRASVCEAVPCGPWRFERTRCRRRGQSANTDCVRSMCPIRYAASWASDGLFCNRGASSDKIRVGPVPRDPRLSRRTKSRAESVQLQAIAPSKVGAVPPCCFARSAGNQFYGDRIASIRRYSSSFTSAIE